MKKCTKCKKVKPISGFSRNKITRDGYQGNCKVCHALIGAEWRKNNIDKSREKSRRAARTFRAKFPERVKEQSRLYYKLYKEKYLTNQRDKRLEERLLVLDKYGRKCACCGEKEVKFLALDHINGGGNKHRREIGYKDMIKWAIKNKFPNIFQLLCHNCNMAKSLYGNCPHLEKVRD